MTNLTSFLVLLLIISIIWVFDRKNFKKEGTLFYLRRTKKGLIFIDKIGEKYNRLLKVFGDLAVIFSFGGLGVWYLLSLKKTNNKKALTLIFSAVLLVFLQFFFGLTIAIPSALFGAAGFIVTYLVKLVYLIILKEVTTSGIQLVLPFEVENAPVFYVPMNYWLASIFVILIVHELSHALVSRAERIRVKSLGYGFLAIIPVGFAEPDEKELKKTTSIKKARVYAAGSFSNILVAIVVLCLLPALNYADSLAFQANGVEYESLTSGMPSVGVLPTKGVITSVKGTEIKNITSLAMALERSKPNETLSLTINSHPYLSRAGANPANHSQAYIGIYKVKTHLEVKKEISNTFGENLPWSLIYTSTLLMWLLILNLGIGLTNLLPIKPLDGGLLLEEIITSLKIPQGKALYRIISITVLGLVLFNIFGPIIL